MLLVIGERVYDHRATEPVLAGWNRLWAKYGIRAAMRTPAFVHGPAKARLDRVLGDDKVFTNVLPPDCEAGSWDAELAETIMKQFMGYLPHTPKYSGFVLLGRRVADLFFDNTQFGETHYIGLKPTLILPHPSGRSRVWNEDGFEDKVRTEWVPHFLERIECLPGL